MPPPKKRRYRSSRPSHNRHHPPATAPAVSVPAGPEVKPEIASIIQRTRTATTREELRQLCQEAIELKLNDPDTLRAFYQKKMDALPAE